ncbi:MAG TPA: U32 family peptidase [Anaeromyxobacter sp.]|nr:U32 family peptidase [Anaeromyxobacter sp.]
MPEPRPPRRPELLAPAGGLEAGLAAFQYGADAVYLGLQRYSARADAQNFTLDELDRLLGYARSLTPRRRCFVAVNTLVLDGELGGLVETLGALADLGADAVIVQDLGVARVARRHFPELELHASTQLAAHSAAAVETLRDLGFARVTLARELTLAEIRAAAAVPGVEVETFLHGALCYAYSGLCLYSSLLLGRSGNRGQCAYPCRDRWEVTSFNGTAPAVALAPDQRRGFAFSMKDLALPDHVGALRDAGVACLKIEGRKKAPLYVAAAVDFYRRLLDGALPAEERPAREADLQATFARPWTTLYLDDHRDKDVADRDHVGHRGTPVGTLDAVVKGTRGAAVRFRTSRPLAVHDGLQIEVPGLDRPFGFGVAALRVVEGGRAGAETFDAPAGAVVEVPLPDGYPTLPLGAAVSCSSSQGVKLRYRLDRPNLAPHRARRGMRVAAEVGAARVRLEATAEVAPGRTVRAEAEVAGRFEPARDAGKMVATARAALEKLGDTRFALAELAWRDPEGRFVPVSRLNDARRALVEALDGALRADVAARVEAAKGELGEGRGSVEKPGAGSGSGAAGAVAWILKTDRLSTFDAFPPEELAAAGELVVDLGREPVRDLVARLDALAARAGGREKVRLALPLLVRAWEEKALRAGIAALRAAGFERWELTNAASWALLGLRPGAPHGLDLTSDWPLHCVNRGAAAALRELGVRRVTLSLEDVRANLAALLAALGAAAAVVVYEDAPLFLSESCPYATLRGTCPGPADCTFEVMELASSHGGRVRVVNDRCRSVTLNDAPFSLAPRLRALLDAGARALRVHFVHRPYASAEALAIWRGLREPVPAAPGHTGSFDRAGW